MTLLAGWSPALAITEDQALSPAALVVAQLGSTLPVTLITDYTAQSDPEHLLGSPGQYIAKATFNDSSVSNQDATGIVEVFASQADMNVRYNVVSSSSGERDIPFGTLLLRVSTATPDATLSQYQAALGSLLLR
jgi:hypothetical protein